MDGRSSCKEDYKRNKISKKKYKKRSRSKHNASESEIESPQRR